MDLTTGMKYPRHPRPPAQKNKNTKRSNVETKQNKKCASRAAASGTLHAAHAAHTAHTAVHTTIHGKKKSMPSFVTNASYSYDSGGGAHGSPPFARFTNDQQDQHQ